MRCFLCYKDLTFLSLLLSNIQCLAIYSSNYKSPNPDNAPHATKGDFGGKRAYASSSTPVQHNTRGHGGKKVSVPTLDAKDAVYKDPDLDNNLRGGHSGPVRLNQLVYNCVENLKATKRSNRDPNSGLEQGPEYDYKDPDYKDPDYRDPDYKDPDYRDPDYKDPDLDPDLRDKKQRSSWYKSTCVQLCGRA